MPPKKKKVAAKKGKPVKKTAAVATDVATLEDELLALPAAEDQDPIPEDPILEDDAASVASVDSEAESVLSDSSEGDHGLGDGPEPTPSAVGRIRKTEDSQKVKFECEDIYEGQIKDGMRHGHGSYRWLYGGSYVGEFSESFQHGVGKHKYPNGDVYDGEWKLDLRDGFGKMNYVSSGRQYDGEWKDDKPHGNGTETSPDGVSYSGQWIAGLKSGQGSSAFGSGDRYEGMHEQGRRCGYGTLTYKDDADGAWDGEWKDGDRHGRGILFRAPQDTVLRQVEIVGWAALLCAEADLMEIGPNIGGPSCGYLPEPEEPEEGKAASETDGKAAAAGDASVEEEKAEEEDEVHQVGWQELLDEFVTCATAVPESEAAAPSSRGSQRSGGSARAESPKHSDQRSDSGLFAAGSIELGAPGPAARREGSPLHGSTGSRGSRRSPLTSAGSSRAGLSTAGSLAGRDGRDISTPMGDTPTSGTGKLASLALNELAAAPAAAPAAGSGGGGGILRAGTGPLGSAGRDAASPAPSSRPGTSVSFAGDGENFSAAGPGVTNLAAPKAAGSPAVVASAGPAEVSAATKIQAAQRGRAVRAKESKSARRAGSAASAASAGSTGSAGGGKKRQANAGGVGGKGGKGAKENKKLLAADRKARLAAVKKAKETVAAAVAARLSIKSGAQQLPDDAAGLLAAAAAEQDLLPVEAESEPEPAESWTTESYAIQKPAVGSVAIKDKDKDNDQDHFILVVPEGHADVLRAALLVPDAIPERPAEDEIEVEGEWVGNLLDHGSGVTPAGAGEMVEWRSVDGRLWLSRFESGTGLSAKERAKHPDARMVASLSELTDKPIA